MPDPDTAHDFRAAVEAFEFMAGRASTQDERMAVHCGLHHHRARAEKAERQVEAERERCARVCDDEAEALRVSHEPGAAMCLEDAARRIREPPQAEEPTP